MFNAPRQSARLIGLALLLFTALSPSASLADEQDAATRLFTEAVHAVQQVEFATSFDEQLDVIGKAEAILMQIVEQYPQSHIGKALAEGQGPGGLGLPDLHEARTVVLNRKIEYETNLAQRIELDRQYQEKIEAQIVRDPCFSEPDAACLLTKLESDITSIVDPRSRGDTLVQTAALHLSIGNKAQADTNLKIALDITRGLPEESSWYSPSTKYNIARLATEASNVEFALQTAEVLEQDDKESIQLLVVENLGNAGRYDEAIQTLSGISSPAMYVRGSLHLAKSYRQHENGDLFHKEMDRTKQYIDQISDQVESVEAMILLLNGLVEAELKDDAIRLFKETLSAIELITSPVDQSLLYMRVTRDADKIIERRWARDLFQRSFDAIHEVEDSKLRAKLAAYLTETLIKVGETEDAQKIYRFGLNELSKTGELKARVSLAWNFVISEEDRDVSLFHEELSSILQRELDTARLALGPWQTMQLMIDISMMQFEAGAKGAARVNLDRLASDVESIKDPIEAQGQLEMIAEYQRLFSDYSGAMETLEMARGMAFQANNVYFGGRMSVHEDSVQDDIAATYASQGHHNTAIHEVLKIDDDDMRSSAYIKLAQRQAEIGSIGEAIRTMLRVKDKAIRAPALIAMVMKLIRAGDNSMEFDNVLWRYAG